jgi:rhomboid family GlyGly-CTERM serine protease
MNVEAPRRGFDSPWKRLNFDGRHGLALLGLVAFIALPEMVGDWARTWLSFDRAAVAGGQWWRLLTANFIHLDPPHTMVNVFGFVLMWALFLRDYSPLRWVAIYLGAALAVGIGLWFFAPGVVWYVGASGALHGVMAAGTLAHLKRGDLDAWVLAPALVLKLGYEQVVGAMPFSDSGSTIVASHLFGAIGGLAIALVQKSRREPL